MSNEVVSAALTPPSAPDLAIVQAEPQPLEVDRQRTAVVVIDMQNAFASKGAMYDLRGFDISGIQKIIEPIRKVNSVARGKGIKVLYIVTRYSSDLRESGGPNSPRWHKGSLAAYREHPEWRDKLLTRGTWGADIVEGLKPQKGDIVVEKARYSAFFGTNLDIILKTHNIKCLVFMGVATNICVEATIRSAYYLDYFPILVSDAAANVGPQFTQDATIFNVKLCYGWVTTTENILKAL
jgi:ureidoacrylate peracid hydrolase